jgi:PAS domain S-box-containing protein
MNWVTIIWAMVAAACLTLAVLHGLVWWRQREALASLLFSLTAAATAAQAGTELWAMLAQTTGEFGRALWWAHLPFWVVLVSLVGFVRLYLRAGRRWLAWTVCGLRTLALILNFVFSPNVNYREITALRHVQFLGSSVSVPVGTPNPWMMVGQLGSLLFIIFVADATLTLWRRGGRRQAVALGGVILFFVAVAAVEPVLVFWGIVQMPITISLFYMGVVAGMGFELSRDVIRAAQLARELQMSEAGLRESQRRLELAAAIVDSSDDAILSKTLEGTITTWNAGAEKMYGYSAAEMIGRDVSTLAPDDLKSEVMDILRNLRLGENVDHLETLRVTKDGRTIDVSITISPIRNERGVVIGASTIARDITDRKRAENEAQQQRQELAHLSRVTMLGELSGSMAHELNQPLMAILSNAQAAQRFMAHDNIDLDEVREILADIVEQDNRAGEVIRRLRLLLKKGEVQVQPLDVNDAVREVLKLIRGDLANQGVTAHTELGPELPRVKGDRVQLQQVLLNVLMNACDAMNENAPGDRQMVVRTELSDGADVRFSVSDRGAGVDPAKLEEVFDPFFSTKTHGLGLGLSVCRSIISAHGGKLWAVNNPEGGATFCFTLPVNIETTP